MTPDPTLRADLIAFLANTRGRIRISTPDYRPMCTGYLPSFVQCGADRDLTSSRYCAECRRDYRAFGRQRLDTFHDDEKQILRAYRLLRRRAARRLEAA